MLHRIALIVSLALCISLGAISAAADFTPIARKLPPKGVALPVQERDALQKDLDSIAGRIKALESKPDVADLLADVRIYEKAVRLAVQLDEFYPFKPASTKPSTKPAADLPRGVSIAHDLLKTASARLDALEKGEHPWTTGKGQIARGYISSIDGSAQPYGLEIPEEVDLDKPAPLMVWLHGRGDEETDLYFIKGREGKRGQLQPKGAIVLNVFGRQCVGWKSAGEIDVLEAIASVEKRYKIDENRIVLAGFSMGGAGAWHIGAHYADRWCCVHTGAGFVDVKNYQQLTPDKMPPAVEQKLWGLYDVPDYVHNLFNVPVVSYSGEIDSQRAAAELMAKTFQQEGHELTHLIGPGVPHRYEPKTLIEVMKRIDRFIEKGREPNPKHAELQTRTLRYNRMFWLEATGLGEHWADTRIDATREEIPQGQRLIITTKNVTSFSVACASLANPSLGGAMSIEADIDGNKLTATGKLSHDGRLWFTKGEKGWAVDPQPPDTTKLAKRPGLQGPIDDAFMAPFLFVAPTGNYNGPAVRKWVEFEMRHQQDRWRELMRGDVRIKKDTEVTPEDVQKYNLILWGDVKSNKVIAQIAAKLPATWAGGKLKFDGKTFDAAKVLPALIYPNPLNPSKYVVLNSGLTFREAHDGTNSLQNPKLGDWAILDITMAPTATTPAGILMNGFFDEAWAVKK